MLWQEEVQDGGRDAAAFWPLAWPSSQPRHAEEKSHNFVCDTRRRRTSASVRCKCASVWQTYWSAVFCRTRFYHSMLEHNCRQGVQFYLCNINICVEWLAFSYELELEEGLRVFRSGSCAWKIIVRKCEIKKTYLQT